MGQNLISLMILLPFLGALSQVFVPNEAGKTKYGFARLVGIFSSLISSVVGLSLVFSMKANTASIQYSEVAPWLGSYAINYSVGIDGLNALLVLLIAIVFPVLLLSEWNRQKGARGIYGLFLLLQSALLGVVCAQDLFLMFFFWTLSSVPFYFLIAIWGEKEREVSAFRYMVTASTGNALMFVSLILIYYSVDPHTFSLAELVGGRLSDKAFTFLGVEMHLATLAFLLFSLGLALRLPIWPIHGWYSFLATESPPAVLVALCGAFVPTALYIFTRSAYSLFPAEVFRYSEIILTLGIVNVILGSLTAIAQKELKLFLAFLCLAQVGFMLIGVGSLDSAGIVGALYQCLTVGLAMAGFGLFSGIMVERSNQSRFLRDSGKTVFGGVSSHAPMMALLTGVILVSLLGLPGLGGFVGQSLIIMGGYTVHPAVIVVMAFGVLIATFATFSLYRFIFLGKPGEVTDKVFDLSAREKSYLFPLVGGLLFLGLYPKPFLGLVKPSILTLLSIVK